MLDEAISLGCNLVVSHHPLLFHALKHLTEDTLPERCARYAVMHDLTIYSAHTNLDNCEGGVNYEIARRMDLHDLALLQPHADGGGSGVVGTLPAEMSAEDFLHQLKRTFEVECLELPSAMFAGAERAADDAVAAGADAFVTGEMHYHEYFGLEHRIQIAVMGHYQSEHYTKHLLAEIIRHDWPEVKLVETTINTNPIRYI